MKTPKTRNNGTMTEAAFFGWIRSLLRNRYMRGWKPHNEAAKDNRRPITYKSRSRWEYQCANCNDWFLRKEIDIDHIIPCGTLKSFDDLAVFCNRLFVEKDGLQVLCKPCHKNKTHDKKTD
jgi:5-methylcytosine-specific restriction endonuclease McrA